MNATGPDLSIAPDLAAHLRSILRGLQEHVAIHARLPLLATIAVRLSNYLAGAIRALEHRLARLAAGRLPSVRGPLKTPRRAPATRQPSPFPRGFGWLTAIIGYQAVGSGGQLEYLLAQPGVGELLALDPAIARILAPIRHMLGFPRRAPRPPKPTPMPRPAPKPAPRRAPPRVTEVLYERQIPDYSRRPHPD